MLNEYVLNTIPKFQRNLFMLPASGDERHGKTGGAKWPIDTNPLRAAFSDPHICFIF